MSQNLRPLDIGKLDFEGNRKRHRKKLFRWSLAPVIVIGVGCLWLLLPTVATHQASVANGSGAYGTAERWLGILITNSLFEPYKWPFNRAIVATNAKKFDTAGEFFRQAIALAPESEKCFIRVQWVLSSELAGDDSLTRNDTQSAITYYTKALSDMTTYSQCFKEYSGLSLRVATKLAQIVNQLKKEAYQDQTATPNSTKTESETPSDDQLKQLENMQKNGQVNKQEATRKTDLDLDYRGKRW